jgi:hypothetical protein
MRDSVLILCSKPTRLRGDIQEPVAILRTGLGSGMSIGSEVAAGESGFGWWWCGILCALGISYVLGVSSTHLVLLGARQAAGSEQLMAAEDGAVGAGSMLVSAT